MSGLTARQVVRAAAERSESAREWLTRDEWGSWEKQAQEMIDATAERRSSLGMEDAVALEELADRLAFRAVSALLEDAKKRRK